jgi:hypothetical protein
MYNSNKKKSKKSKKSNKISIKPSREILNDDESDNDIVIKTQLNPIIRNSLEYYDLNMIAIKKFSDKIEFINFKRNPNDISDKIIFYNKDKKKILESNYEILSVFNNKNGSWKWAWAVSTFRKKQTFIVRKILDYAFTLNNNEDYIIKSLLINSKINIQNNLQHDIIIALSSYLTKIPFIFKFYYAGAELTEEITGLKLDDDFFKSNEKLDHEQQEMSLLSPVKMISNSGHSKNLIALYVYVPNFVPNLD